MRVVETSGKDRARIAEHASLQAIQAHIAEIMRCLVVIHSELKFYNDLYFIREEQIKNGRWPAEITSWFTFRQTSPVISVEEYTETEGEK